MDNVNKSQFRNSSDFQEALRQREYRDQEPVDAKIASMCLKGTYDSAGPNTSNSVGTCALSEECTFRNDKIRGVSGICLKSVVGVKPSTDKKGIIHLGVQEHAQYPKPYA